MNGCSTSKSTSSLKELYMINAQTYNALLNKLTSLERSEIDRLNTLPSQSRDENLSMPSDSVLSTNNETLEKNSCSSVKSASITPRIQSRLKETESDLTHQNREESDSNFNEHETLEEDEPVLGETQVPIQLDSNSRKRKRAHKMPHLVTLSTGPGILKKEKTELVQKKEDTISNADKDKQEDKTDDINESVESENNVPDLSGKRSRFQCPVCEKYYKNSFTRFRHMSSMHPSSEATKEAWDLKKARELKNRNKMKLKTKAIKHLNHTVKPVSASSKRGMKRGRVEDEEKYESSKKQQLEVLDPSKVKKRPSVSASKIRKNKLTGRNVLSKKIEATPLDSDDEIMTASDKPEKSKATIAGVKRSKEAETFNTKAVRSVAPKRKAKEVAKKALKGKRSRSSNTAKVAKLTTDESSDDEYRQW